MRATRSAESTREESERLHEQVRHGWRRRIEPGGDRSYDQGGMESYPGGLAPLAFTPAYLRVCCLRQVAAQDDSDQEGPTPSQISPTVKVEVVQVQWGAH